VDWNAQAQLVLDMKYQTCMLLFHFCALSPTNKKWGSLGNETTSWLLSFIVIPSTPQRYNDNHSCICAYLCIPLTGQDNLQDKVYTLQDKVDTVQYKVVNLEDKLDTFQNATEASTWKNHHEVVELLQNTSCSFDGKI